MSSTNYTYDLAISFLHEDEELAFQLYNLLKDRVNCFIYTEQQKRLAGRNGEDEFNTIFGIESRTVAVLYRDGWGDKGFTKIEETAIRNKAHDEGYDFVLFIPLQSPANPPKWLPKNRLWIGIKRWGIEGAASFIESAVHSFGGEVKELSTVEKAIIEDDKRKTEVKNLALIDSIEGVQKSNDESLKIKTQFETKFKELNESIDNWDLRISNTPRGGIRITCQNYSMFVQWNPYATNSAKDANLVIVLWDGYFDERLNRTERYDYKELINEKRRFHIDNLGRSGWVDFNSNDNFVTTESLVDKWLGLYFDKIKEIKN